jgi:hypothetical protein
LVLRPAIFDHYVLSINITDFRETPPDGVHAASISFARAWGKESDHRDRGLLCAPHDRPCYRRAANELDKLAPLDISGHAALPQVMRGQGTIARFYERGPGGVGLPSDSGGNAEMLASTLSAKTRLMHRSKTVCTSAILFHHLIGDCE